MWNHIRENNLQDPNNRRTIICDESLHALFSVDSIDMFQMNKVLAKHIWPLNDEAGIYFKLFLYFITLWLNCPKAFGVIVSALQLWLIITMHFGFSDGFVHFYAYAH